jgi:hypothetical protein
MSIGNIVENAAAATKSTNRVNYGLDLRVGSFRLNEWAFSPTQAKLAHERLVKNGDQPFEVASTETMADGSVRTSYITVRRSITNDLSAALAG